MKGSGRNAVTRRLSTPTRDYLPHRPSKSASVLLAALVLCFGIARNADASPIILPPDDTRPSVLTLTPLPDSNRDFAKLLKQEIAGPSITLKTTFTYAKTYDAFIQAGKELAKKPETRNAAVDSFANAIKMAPEKARKEIFALDDGIKPLWLQALNKAGARNASSLGAEPEKKHSIWPWLIGGAAVLAAAVYFLTKKKSSTTTTPAETVATLHGSVRGLIKGGPITDGTVTLVSTQTSGISYSSPIAAEGTFSIINIKNPANYKRIKLSSSQAITRETNIALKAGDNLFDTDMIEADATSGYEYNDYLTVNSLGRKINKDKEYKVFIYDQSVFEYHSITNTIDVVATLPPDYLSDALPKIKDVLQNDLPIMSKSAFKYNGVLRESEGASGPGIPTQASPKDGWFVIYVRKGQTGATQLTSTFADLNFNVISAGLSIAYTTSVPTIILPRHFYSSDICAWAGFLDAIKKSNYSIFGDDDNGFPHATSLTPFDKDYISVIKNARLPGHNNNGDVPDYDPVGSATLNSKAARTSLSSSSGSFGVAPKDIGKMVSLLHPEKIEARADVFALGADPSNGSIYLGLGGKSGGIKTALNLTNGFGNFESYTTATFNKGGFAGNAAMRRASGVEVYDADVSTNIGGVAVGVVDAFDAKNNANLLSVRLGAGGSDGRKNDFTGQQYVINYRMAQSNTTKAQFVDAQAVFGKILVNGSYGNINANSQQMTEYSLGAAAQLGVIVLTTSYRDVNSAINPYQQYSVGGNGSIGRVYFSGSYSRVSMNNVRQDMANAGVSAPLGPGNLNLGFICAPGIRDTRVSYSIFVGL